MKNLYKSLAIIAIVAVIGFAFTACDDGNNNTNGNGNGNGNSNSNDPNNPNGNGNGNGTNDNATVYIVGSSPSGGEWPDLPKACYWKDGVRTFLPHEETPGLSTSVATGIAVSGDSIYIIGEFRLQKGYYDRAFYWKNGVQTFLPVPEETTSSQARAIAVSGGSVYIAGTYRDDNDWTNCYWKDGVRTDLPFINTEYNGEIYEISGTITSIAASGGSVYIAGWYYEDVLINGNYIGSEVPCYWKDGVRTDLPKGAFIARATSITVSGGSVYIAGYDGGRALYWKDGERTYLTGSLTYDYAESIAVSGGSVYVGGFSNDDSSRIACYWKDGIKTDLPLGSNANSIAILGNSIYIAGTLDGHVCYWKDGKVVLLPPSGSSYNSSGSFGIAVAPK
jgi:uncharacterized membrane protein